MASSSKINLANSAMTAATTDGTSNLLPAKARKLIGHITTAATNGATTVTAKIQHSPDKTNWYDYIAFTAIVGTNTSELKNPASNDLAVMPYVRSTVALSGATKASTVTIDLWYEDVG
jgi:hypothetical protein